jgi:dipeptidyl aminopeptidase/acylaminoacyl peptidase
LLVQTADTTALAAPGAAAPESLRVRLDDGTVLHGIIYKPADFDPARRYAVIDYIYGGPWLSVVPWDYTGTYMTRQAGAFAQLGFIVVMVDARGTPGRGKAFQDYNYGRIGQTEIAEHVTAIRRAAATRPWMDTARVGIFGHSWGGYYALRGMLTAPEFFRAGYAGAPGALGEEALINEPNMNLEPANPEGWRAGANEPLAANLRGALKMMHGTSDVNASLSTTMRMAEALIRANRRFELLLMPGQGHGPQPQRYYQDDILRFFWRNLGGPR